MLIGLRSSRSIPKRPPFRLKTAVYCPAISTRGGWCGVFRSWYRGRCFISKSFRSMRSQFSLKTLSFRPESAIFVSFSFPTCPLSKLIALKPAWEFPLYISRACTGVTRRVVRGDLMIDAECGCRSGSPRVLLVSNPPPFRSGLYTSHSTEPWLLETSTHSGSCLH